MQETIAATPHFQWGGQLLNKFHHKESILSILKDFDDISTDRTWSLLDLPDPIQYTRSLVVCEESGAMSHPLSLNLAPITKRTRGTLSISWTAGLPHCLYSGDLEMINQPLTSVNVPFPCRVWHIPDAVTHGDSWSSIDYSQSRF